MAVDTEMAMSARAIALRVLVAFACIATAMLCGMRLYDSFVIDAHWSGSVDSIRAWWAAADRIDGIGFIERFGPVLGGSAVLIAILSFREGPPLRKWLALYVVTIVFIAAWSNLYFMPLEASLPEAAASLPDEELRALIDRWMTWKLVRLGVGIAALLFVARALSLAAHRSMTRGGSM